MNRIPSFNPLRYPICYSHPLRIEESAWLTHVPFGMLLVDLLRPGVLVELGTQRGVSYCAFCQAIKELGLETRSYAVDTWEGDPHSGFYGPEIFHDLRNHHDPLYGSFSRFVKSTFDGALEHFKDGEIDLLHLDGYHTYENVKHDFEHWLPKMSRSGVLLLHDTNVREEDFGAWKVWEELRGQYPQFEFLHGHGLGLLAVGEEVPESLEMIFQAPEEEKTQIKRFFYQLGQFLERRFEDRMALAHQRKALSEQTEIIDSLDKQKSAKDRTIDNLVAEQSGWEDQRKQWELELASQTAAHETEVRRFVMSEQHLQEAMQDLREKNSQSGQAINELKQEIQRRDRQISTETERASGLQIDLTHRILEVQSLEEELLYYQTGFLPPVMRWARDWAYRYLPVNSRRRRFAKAIGRSLFAFLSGGPSGLLRYLRERKKTPSHSRSTQAFDSAGEVETKNVDHHLGHLSETQETLETSEEIPNEAVIQAKLKAQLSEFLDSQRRLVFPKTVDPTVSILIPTYNKAELTLHCLENILAHSQDPYEVILVDDASTDDTYRLLERVDHATVLYNQQNLEFIRANNLGAGHIRGKYVLFLNNDVQPTSGWLRSLLETMELIPDCGAVGSKLIWPNRKLQEAGSIVWQDGSALGYGRGDDPSRPEYNYLREVDYCSGACLLVRTDLFKELGFFDERYCPAFYEDTDLCFGIRSLGYKVYFQPGSEVIHNEFGSRSAARAAELCASNQAKFYAKWREVLPDQLPAEPTNPKFILRARDRREGKRVLFIDDMIPAPRLGSGFPRARSMIEFLVDLGNVVTFIPQNRFTKWQPDTRELQRQGVEVFYEDWVDLEAHLKERPEYYDVIVVSRPHNGQRWLKQVKRYNPQALIVYDAEAIFARRDILQAQIEGVSLSEGQINRKIQDELSVMQHADIVITVSEAEKRLILEHQQHDRIEVWGHVHPVIYPEQSYEARKDLLFVGGFTAGHPPNTDAVLHFTQQVLPLIHEKLPDCKFYVVGSNPTQEIRALASDQVVVTGYVEDLRDFYESCRVFVVPLRFAGGIAYKVTEALSYGIPMVISPVAAAGLEVKHGSEVLIAQDDQDYAEKVIELYSDPQLWESLRDRSLNFVEQHYAPDPMRAQLAKILHP